MEEPEELPTSGFASDGRLHPTDRKIFGLVLLAVVGLLSVVIVRKWMEETPAARKSLGEPLPALISDK